MVFLLKSQVHCQENTDNTERELSPITEESNEQGNFSLLGGSCLRYSAAVHCCQTRTALNSLLISLRRLFERSQFCLLLPLSPVLLCSAQLSWPSSVNPCPREGDKRLLFLISQRRRRRDCKVPCYLLLVEPIVLMNQGMCHLGPFPRSRNGLVMTLDLTRRTLCIWRNKR